MITGRNIEYLGRVGKRNRRRQEGSDPTTEEQPDDPMLKRAILRAFRAFKLEEKVKVIHLNDIFKDDDIDIWDETPGLPWIQRGYKTKGDIRRDEKAINLVRKFAKSLKNGKNVPFPDCLVRFVSYTCESGETKTREEWDYPATITFIEAMFAVPLMNGYEEQFSYHSRPLAFDLKEEYDRLEEIIERFRGRTNYTEICFRDFDRTVPPWLLDIAFLILSDNIDFCHYDGYGIPDASKLYNMYCTLCDYFIDINMRTANGFRFKKSAGVTRDSYFTGLVGSICNYILINWMSLEQFGACPNDTLVLGEESLIASFGKWDLDKCAALVSRIGMDLDVVKSGQSRDLFNMSVISSNIGCGPPFKSLYEKLAWQHQQGQNTESAGK